MKRLVARTTWTVNGSTNLYNAKGECLGYVVEEMEAFTKEELANARCPECNAANGHHWAYFVKTGQDGADSVEGRYQNCSRMEGK